MTDSGRKLRVLVAIHQLDLGGSQTNAVDLASGVRDRGHEVVVAGPHGPLVEVIRERGLAYEPVELDRMDRARVGFGQLRAAVRRMRPDLLHTYELIPSLLGFAGPHREDGTPMTMTINSMSVPGFMPGSVPLQVCNPVIAAAVRRRSGSVGVLEIPTDCVTQSPSFPGGGFRSEIGVADDELLVVVVSRFARVLKQEGLEAAIAAVGRLAEGRRVRLAMVGDGPAMPDLRALAEKTNGRVGRPAVVLTGMRSDPRSAYAAADVVLGMGGSLLRAMAFGKPCIVQGEGGYWRILDEDSAREFRWRGFYGIGSGAPGVDLLTELLGRLLDDDVLRRRNGEFALDLVRQCYSLDHAVDQQLEWYRLALREHRPPPTSELVRTAASVGSWVAGRAVARVRGTASADTFNSQEQIEPGFRAPVPSSFRPQPVRRGTTIRPEPDIAGGCPVPRRDRSMHSEPPGAMPTAAARPDRGGPA